MIRILQYTLESDPLGVVLGFMLAAVLVIIEFALACGILYLFYFLLTLPMRRNERARLFLDLIELGLKDGRTPEVTVLEASASRDRGVGVRFHLLAAYLQKGLRFSDALDAVPRLLPPQVRAMLKTGERIGDVAKVLPACRLLLRDAVSQVRGALNYLVILMFCITPFTVFVPFAIRVYVMPKYQEIFANMMEGERLPAFTRWVFEFTHSSLGYAFQVGLFLLMWLVILAYVGGPRAHSWLRQSMPNLVDRILWCLPWRRKRLQRDFSAMLAVLLDASVPEAEAVTLAGEATANATFIHRARKVLDLLNDGAKLPEALHIMDRAGELRWRLANALHRRGGFLRALTGWHEALDARAFQLEQTAAQTVTTAFVLLNGFIVAVVMLAVFLALIAMIQHASLW